MMFAISCSCPYTFDVPVYKYYTIQVRENNKIFHPQGKPFFPVSPCNLWKKALRVGRKRSIRAFFDAFQCFPTGFYAGFVHIPALSVVRGMEIWYAERMGAAPASRPSPTFPVDRPKPHDMSPTVPRPPGRATERESRRTGTPARGERFGPACSTYSAHMRAKSCLPNPQKGEETPCVFN
ncbi:hypothetical protein [Ethanoligenens harbinense]|uniref:hypothetical protein n=1 Tax=Ethanoligenens harbinense TaxID=253239 RepID=UPI0013C4D1E3|nr:hypothetical protein [Ethanoligenens harbinense]